MHFSILLILYSVLILILKCTKRTKYVWNMKHICVRRCIRCSTHPEGDICQISGFILWRTSGLLSQIGFAEFSLEKEKLFTFSFLNNLEKVIHAFITSRLDYCSSLYIRLGEALLSLLCTRSKMLLVNRLLTSGWKHFTHAGIVTLATCTWFVYSLISSCIGLPLRLY